MDILELIIGGAGGEKLIINAQTISSIKVSSSAITIWYTNGYRDDLEYESNEEVLKKYNEILNFLRSLKK